MARMAPVFDDDPESWAQYFLDLGFFAFGVCFRERHRMIRTRSAKQVVDALRAIDSTWYSKFDRVRARMEAFSAPAGFPESHIDLELLYRDPFRMVPWSPSTKVLPGNHDLEALIGRDLARASRGVFLPKAVEERWSENYHWARKNPGMEAPHRLDRPCTCSGTDLDRCWGRPLHLRVQLWLDIYRSQAMAERAEYFEFLPFVNGLLPQEGPMLCGLEGPADEVYFAFLDSSELTKLERECGWTWSGRVPSKDVQGRPPRSRPLRLSVVGPDRTIQWESI